MNTLIQNRIQAKRNENGFTLIELLVVIAILGILAAIVVFSVGGLNNKSQESACKAEQSTILTASEAYFAQAGSYPATIDALTSTAAGTPPKIKLLNSTPKLYSVNGTGGTTVTAAGGTAGCLLTYP